MGWADRLSVFMDDFRAEYLNLKKSN